MEKGDRIVNVQKYYDKVSRLSWQIKKAISRLRNSRTFSDLEDLKMEATHSSEAFIPFLKLSTVTRHKTVM